MSDVEIRVDGSTVHAEAGATVAAALVSAGIFGFRSSVSATPRGPLCGMGTCYECRVTINGVHHRRACMTVVAPGMDVATRD